MSSGIVILILPFASILVANTPTCNFFLLFHVFFVTLPIKFNTTIAGHYYSGVFVPITMIYIYIYIYIYIHMYVGMYACVNISH